MGPLTQEDPIGIAGGLNLYGYANGDPINFSDPFGLCPESGEIEGEECVEIEGIEVTVDGGEEEDQSEAVTFVGGCASVVVAVGGGGCAGLRFGDSVWDLGIYSNGSIGFGLDVSGAVEGGIAYGEAPLDGNSVYQCTTVYGAISGCGSYGNGGGSGSFRVGASPFIVGTSAGGSTGRSVTLGQMVAARLFFMNSLFRRAIGRSIR